MVNILVVDDHSTSQRLISFILQQQQYNPVVAADGLQALDRLAERDFDLVITDLYMPALDGIGLIRRMRGDTRYHAIPVVILTGHVHNFEHSPTNELGAVAFLTKPVGSDELIATVQRLLAVRIVDEAVPPPPEPDAVSRDRNAAATFLGLRLKKKIHVI